MALTDTAIRNAKAVERPTKLFDGGGLHLLVNPSGSRLWRLKYRYAGREKLLALGPYPAIGLKAARLERDRAKEQLAAGIDPAEVRRNEREEAKRASEGTFACVAELLLSKMRREHLSDTTIAKTKWLLAMGKAAFGDKLVRDISARDVLDVLKKCEGAGKLETARRLRSTISRVFRLAVANGLADTDPTFALRGALATPKTTHRAAITELKGMRELMLAIDSYDGQHTTKAALRLVALLVPRPGELRKACWEEFDFSRRIWAIPADRTKMRRPHLIPLSDAAMEILRELRGLCDGTGLMFPSMRGKGRPISENTFNVALRTMGYPGSVMTSHGFRAAFSTIANESGLWNPDAIERALAHIEANSVRRAYARGEHWEERVRMMEWWATELGF